MRACVTQKTLSVWHTLCSCLCMSKYFMSPCHFLCVCFVSLLLLFFCLGVAGTCVNKPEHMCAHSCICMCVWSRQHFVTTALLIFATRKTPCGAQCSESQHWDSTHLNPRVHQTSHDKCVCVDEGMCVNMLVCNFLEDCTVCVCVNENVSMSVYLGVCMCVYVGVCVGEGGRKAG